MRGEHFSHKATVPGPKLLIPSFYKLLKIPQTDMWFMDLFLPLSLRFYLFPKAELESVSPLVSVIASADSLPKCPQ